MLNNALALKKIEPTVYLKQADGGLRQLVRITVENPGPPVAATVSTIPDLAGTVRLGELPPGESVHDFFLDEITAPTDIEFIVEAGEVEVTRQTVPWQSPKHWTVHVVQRSHHDVGYTDLGSTVLRQLAQYLDDAIDMAEATADYPDDARFRIAIEQVWSLWSFLQRAPQERIAKMIELIRAGRFEVTMLFGNLTTELCGSEVLARALYHAARLKRDYGISIVSAEHNDIPGMSWGLCQVLTEAGIKFFAPGLPYYWGWSHLELQNFWDEDTLFPRGMPGAFWWEAPSGKRLLLWHSAIGANGDCRAKLPDLPGRLQELTDQDWPYSVIRWQVIGGQRDNSPYIPDYAHTIKDWNEQWGYPHLVCSTDAKFYEDFVEQIPADLPVFRGELPGQDYPLLATCTAAPTAANRNNHADVPSAEKLATAAAQLTDYPYQAADLFNAYEDILWHDEHTWGARSPCGTPSLTSELEKAVHPYRAAALGHDVLSKAMARIADSIQLDEEGLYMVVFNPEQQPRTGIVRTPLHELDNASLTMIQVPPEDDPKGVGHWGNAELLRRGRVVPGPEVVQGKFDLVDVATGQSVPFQIVELSAPDEPVPYAAQRVGIAEAGRRLGAENTAGMKRDLCFVAPDVPPYGYRAYRLVPQDSQPEATTGVTATVAAGAAVVENDFYRIEVDPASGGIVSLYDRAADRELVDGECSHSFNALIVKGPLFDEDRLMSDIQVIVGKGGPLCASLEITGSAYGHPAVKQSITLYAGVREIHLATRVLKDATALLDVHLAFPFAATQPQFRYEGALAAMTPVADYLPGAYWNRITVQNWVKVTDGDFNIIWSSLDAPMVSLAGLWPDYVSPAHRCHMDERLQRPPVDPARLADNGWIYSNITANNTGTNFSCVQVGDILLRYVITTREGTLADGPTALWARQAVGPMTTILTEREPATLPPAAGTLPPSASFAQIDSEDVVLLACKQAEDGRGIILRLWNMAAATTCAQVTLPSVKIEHAGLTNIIEEDQDIALEHTDNSFTVEIGARAVATVRVLPQT